MNTRPIACPRGLVPSDHRAGGFRANRSRQFRAGYWHKVLSGSQASSNNVEPRPPRVPSIVNVIVADHRPIGGAALATVLAAKQDFRIVAKASSAVLNKGVGMRRVLARTQNHRAAQASGSTNLFSSNRVRALRLIQYGKREN